MGGWGPPGWGWAAPSAQVGFPVLYTLILPWAPLSSGGTRRGGRNILHLQILKMDFLPGRRLGSARKTAGDGEEEEAGGAIASVYPAVGWDGLDLKASSVYLTVL